MTLFSIILYIYWQCPIVTQQLLFLCSLTVSCCDTMFFTFTWQCPVVKKKFMFNWQCFVVTMFFHVSLDSVPVVTMFFHVHLTVSLLWHNSVCFFNVHWPCWIVPGFFLCSLCFFHVQQCPTVTFLCSLIQVIVPIVTHIFMFTDSVLLWQHFYVHWQSYCDTFVVVVQMCPIMTHFLCSLTVSPLWQHFYVC